MYSIYDNISAFFMLKCWIALLLGLESEFRITKNYILGIEDIQRFWAGKEVKAFLLFRLCSNLFFNKKPEKIQLYISGQKCQSKI